MEDVENVAETQKLSTLIELQTQTNNLLNVMVGELQQLNLQASMQQLNQAVMIDQK